MCIILLAYESHPSHRLILAANRDEFYERPTARADFWPDAPQVLAGRDLRGGGTWMGITKDGRIAAVTNFRDTSSRKENAPSRGWLVRDFLVGQDSPAAYLQALTPRASEYDAFNLIVGDRHGLYHYSNRADGIHAFSRGLYGLSNHLLDTSCPKVERGKRAMARLLSQDEISTEAIFSILADRSRADDSYLPDTGVGIDLERTLSPLFVSSPFYGTRSSTVVLINQEDVTFIERSFSTGPDDFEEVKYQFKTEPE